MKKGKIALMLVFIVFCMIVLIYLISPIKITKTIDISLDTEVWEEIYTSDRKCTLDIINHANNDGEIEVKVLGEGIEESIYPLQIPLGIKQPIKMKPDNRLMVRAVSEEGNYRLAILKYFGK